MRSSICLDSNLIIKLVLVQTDSALAETLWERIIRNQWQPVAPPLFSYEVVSVFRRYVHQGIISHALGNRLLQKLRGFEVQEHSFVGIHQRAFDLAQQFNRPTAYDSHYLALAEHLDCEFWTADKKLFNASHESFPFIHKLDEVVDDLK